MRLNRKSAMFNDATSEIMAPARSSTGASTAATSPAIPPMPTTPRISAVALTAAEQGDGEFGDLDRQLDDDARHPSDRLAPWNGSTAVIG